LSREKPLLTYPQKQTNKQTHVTTNPSKHTRTRRFLAVSCNIPSKQLNVL